MGSVYEVFTQCIELNSIIFIKFIYRLKYMTNSPIKKDGRQVGKENLRSMYAIIINYNSVSYICSKVLEKYITRK